MRSPFAQESLTVSTAAVRISVGCLILGFQFGLGVEEDIVFLGHGRVAFVAIGFIQQAQAFHQQALSIEGSALLCGLAFEVHLEVAAGPAQYFEHGCVSGNFAILCVRHLSFAEEHFAAVAFVGQCDLATLTAHLQRLHQINHVHLRQVAAQHAVGRSSLWPSFPARSDQSRA